MIDHALLHPTLTDSDLSRGCELAARYHVASVCVKPYNVKSAAELLHGTGVAVGTVIGFPHGSSITEVKCLEAVRACESGAMEIDMVINIGEALTGDWRYLDREIRAVLREVKRYEALLKVIFETAYLTSDAIKIRLCELCEAAGVDFVKTSTGFDFVQAPGGNFAPRGATEADVTLMRASCSPKVRVKASGNIRTLDTLIQMRELGAARCGTSATAVILDEYWRREKGDAADKTESKGDAAGATPESGAGAGTY